jgi:hypothetical protein
MNAQHDDLEPILCAHLLRRVDEKLIDLLRSLEPSEWDLSNHRAAVESARRRGAPAANFPWFGIRATSNLSPHIRIKTLSR